jgi:hypothetical protein
MSFDNIAKRAIREETAKYNGGTNYATWRVNLEMIDGSDWHCRFDDHGMKPEVHKLAQEIKTWAEEWIEETSHEGLARDYALAFLADVNWREIAEHLIADYVEA